MNIQPPQYVFPEAYWGYLYIDGRLAPSGTNITAITDAGEVVGTGVVHNDDGLYTVLITFDDNISEEDDGADDGEPIMWLINDMETDNPAPWEDKAESGKHNINFTMRVGESTPERAVTTMKFIETVTTTLEPIGKPKSGVKIYMGILIAGLFLGFLLAKFKR